VCTRKIPPSSHATCFCSAHIPPIKMQRSALSSVCLYEANERRPFHLICKPFAVWKHSAVRVTNFSHFSPVSQDCFTPASRTTHSPAYSIIYRACSTGLAFMNHVRSCCICCSVGRASLLNVASQSYSYCGVLERMSPVENKESRQKTSNISRLSAINVHGVVAISVNVGI
jgi:hypothetical protein